MASTNLLQAVGLQTFNNNLDLPPGSLLQADNVNIDRNGVIEPRRGFKQWQKVGTDASMYAYQLINYKNRILAHYPYTTGIPANPISGKLAFDNNAGSFIDFSEDVREVEAGVRIKSVESNGNLYFTTSKGVKKISAKTANDLATAKIINAGGIRALGMDLILDYSASTFLQANYQVGYRIVWGVRDANSNLILGYPSPLNIVTNYGSNDAAVKISFYVPDEIKYDPITSPQNKDYFYQIYRTQPYEYTAGNTVNDELKLVYEGFNDESTNWVTDHYEVIDSYSESLRQANTNLYTNQYSGEGIAYGNIKPPSCKDITLYKNCGFYGNIKSNHQLTNTLLGTDNFIDNLVGYVTAMTNISPTKKHLTVTAHGLDLSWAGKIRIEGSAFDGVYFVFPFDANTIEISFDGIVNPPVDPDPLNQFDPNITKITKILYSISGNNVKTLIYPMHGLSTGDKVCVRGTEFIDGVYSATKIDDNQFSILTNDPTGIKNGFGSHIGYGEIYFSNLSIESGTTTNYYWPVGRQHIEELSFNTSLIREVNRVTFTSTTLADYKGYYINLYNADGFQYVVWFSTANTDTAPLTPTSNQKLIKIDFSNSGLTTTSMLCNKFNDDLSAQIGDFDITTTAGSNISTITTLKAGNCTQMTLIAPASPPPVAPLSVSNPSITNGVGVSIYTDEIILYNADNKQKYRIWFDKTGEDIPPYDLTSAVIRIDFSDSTLLTKQQLCAKFVQELSSKTSDFIVDIKYGQNNDHIAVIKTATSGYCTNMSLAVSSGNLSITHLQTGIGLISDTPTGESFPNQYIIRSTYESSALKNEETVKSLLNAINKNTNEAVYGYYNSTVSGLPGEFTLENREYNDIQFIFSSNTPAVVQSAFNEILPQTSLSEDLPNRIMFSKYSELDSVPLVNYFDVGPRDKEIKRIIGLRDSLFIFKEEGIYRLFGNISTNFQVVLFDSSSNITATDSAVVLNNQIYLLTSQGVARVSETGVNIISRPIENLFVKVANISYHQWTTFGVTYEADRSYLLFVPSEEGDTTATKAFRFNTFTETWTSWNKNYNCGIVHPTENKLYFGAVEDNYIEVERKTLTRTDYSDRVISEKEIISKINNTKITLSNNQNIQIGDSIVQTQKLTLSQINRLINKIKNDSFLNPINAIVLDEAKSYDNLSIKLTEVVNVLNNFDLSLYTQGAAIVLNNNSTISAPGHSFQNGDYVTIQTSDVSNILINTVYKISDIVSGVSFKLKDLFDNIIIPNTAPNPGGILTNIKEIYYSSGSNNFTTLQNQFNDIINKLNSSNGAFFTNYQISEGTTEFEAHIKTYNSLNTQVGIDSENAFIVGDCEIHKGINSIIIYAPQHFGDPSIWKHVRESKIMFEADNFEGAYYGFNTDIANDYEEIAFSMEGNGSWGGVPWGDFTWGGEGLQVPFRTLIPRQKQRCRFIRARFRHLNARNKFAVYGISFIFEGGTERTNK